MSIGFYLGMMVENATVAVAKGVAAVLKTAAAAAYVSYNLIKEAAIGIGNVTGELISKLKDLYKEYKVRSASENAEMEKMFSTLEKNSKKVEIWIKRNKNVVSNDNEIWDEDLVRESISAIMANEADIPYELVENLRSVNEEWENRFTLPPTKKKALIQKSNVLIEQIDNISRQNYAAIKAVMGEDIENKELENIDETIANTVASEKFVDKFEKLLNLVDDIDGKDSKCKHPHHQLKKSIEALIASESNVAQNLNDKQCDCKNFGYENEAFNGNEEETDVAVGSIQIDYSRSGIAPKRQAESAKKRNDASIGSGGRK
ncbi:MAG: hypothetical protein RSB59_00110 [Clostridia bacterium]